MYTGPHIIKDGLVFGYDTGYGIADNVTGIRFYKGQPATNVFTVLGTPSNTDQNVTFDVNGTGTFKRVAVGTQLGDYKVTSDDVVYSYALGVNGCHYHGNDYSSVPIGSKVSLNIEYFLSNDVGSFNSNYLGNFEQLSGVGGSWGAVSSIKGVWHKVALTRTATATGTLRMLMYPGACGGSSLSSTGTIYYKNPTVTITAQPTPFVNGTRSSTASLIDLKETASIDVSNVSFDSTGQPDFDGTNDYLDLGSDVTFKGNGGDWSAEHIVKYDVVPAGYNNSTSPGNFLGGTVNYNSWYWSVLNRKLALWNRSPGVWKYGSTTLEANKFYHVVLVCEPGGTSYKMYLNGVEEGGTNASYVYNASHSGISARYFGVGYAPSTRVVNGKIPVTRIYEKALSATEIKQNFNAYKNRFSI